MSIFILHFRTFSVFWKISGTCRLVYLWIFIFLSRTVKALGFYPYLPANNLTCFGIMDAAETLASETEGFITQAMQGSICFLFELVLLYPHIPWEWHGATWVNAWHHNWRTQPQLRDNLPNICPRGRYPLQKSLKRQSGTKAVSASSQVQKPTPMENCLPALLFFPPPL